MAFSFEFIVDPANKILICEVFGETSKVIDVEHMFKTIVKTAGKNQIKNIVLDTTQFRVAYSSIEISRLMIVVKESGWFDDLKVARLVKPEFNANNVIVGMAEKLLLPIKNFETRSDAMLWLLFDKQSKSGDK